MPNTTAVGGDVDFGGVVRVEDDPMPPFEVVAFEPSPMDPAIRRTIGRRIEAANIEDARICRVQREIVDVLGILEDRSPRLSGVGGKKDTATVISFNAFLAPGREIQPLRVLRIDRQSSGSIGSSRKVHLDPVFRFVCRAIQGSRPRNGRIPSL